MRIKSIRIDSRIPDSAAFITLMVAGALIAWFTIHMGEKIINGAPNSQIFNADKRVQDEIKQVSNPVLPKKNKK